MGAFRILLLAGAVSCAAGAAAAQVRRFDIPAQDATGALQEFARQSGRQVLFSFDAARGRRTPEIRGRIEQADVLARLAAAANLEIAFDNGRTVTLRPRPPEQRAAATPSEVSELVVTGSRIRRADTTTSAPIRAIGPRAFDERGFVQAGQLINDLTSSAPSRPISPGNGSSAGSGQQFPNLFGLGGGRTLTLINGRRMVTSATGLGDRVVDGAVIPTGLIERVDVVQAGGAAVYGSDAIAGVVNYVLKRDFDGVEMDVQYGRSSRDDYPQQSYRATVGRNFDGGRANIAANFEYSKTRPLYNEDRPRTDFPRPLFANPANVSQNDGQPPQVQANDLQRFWPFNTNGVVFAPNPSTGYPAASSGLLARLPGMAVSQGLQASADGRSFVTYNTGFGLTPGSFPGIPFAAGGDGWDYRQIASLYTGVERWNGAATGRYDLGPNARLVGELLYARTRGRDPYGAAGASNTVLATAASGSGGIAFTRANAFLTDAQIATLDQASATFRNGGALFLSKQWADLLPTREALYATDTWRALVGLEGDVGALGRAFYYSASYSRAETDGRVASWAVNVRRMANAVHAVRDAMGRAVCAINADAVPANDDAACAPLNIFGIGSFSHDAQAYVVTPGGQDFLTQQDNLLLTLGGDLFDLPAGPLRFSAAYEYRREKAKFVPALAAQQGLLGQGVPTPANRGAFDTQELSAEVLIPLLGETANLPLAAAVEANGSYRLVDHSVAGRETVWGAGLRWDTGLGLTLRASKSRNFRAPTLNMLFEPTRVALGGLGGGDPCDFRYINQGAVPLVRQANCRALFAANPGYGPLATFQSDAANFPSALITAGGNPDLRNEVSDTTTWGLVYQPAYAPGLTFVADRIEIDMRDGLSAFNSSNFLNTCFDSTPQPADVCAAVVRGATGQIVSGRTTTFNAGRIRYRGEVYALEYDVPLAEIFGDFDPGRLNLAVEATHTTRLETSVTGFDVMRSDGVAQGPLVPNGLPDWSVRLDARYRRGPISLTYALNYLPPAKPDYSASIETTQYPDIKANVRHSLSAQYEFGRYALRGGVTNLTDEQPSWPTRTYGDILGRQYFAGLRARF